MMDETCISFALDEYKNPMRVEMKREIFITTLRADNTGKYEHDLWRTSSVSILCGDHLLIPDICVQIFE